MGVYPEVGVYPVLCGMSHIAHAQLVLFGPSSVPISFSTILEHLIKLFVSSLERHHMGCDTHIKFSERHMDGRPHLQRTSTIPYSRL